MVRGVRGEDFLSRGNTRRRVQGSRVISEGEAPKVVIGKER